MDGASDFDITGFSKPIWTVLSGILCMCKNDRNRTAAVFDSSSFLAYLLYKYAVIEAFYRSKPTSYQDEFEDAIVDVYEALFQYSMEIEKSLALPLLSKSNTSYTESN